MSQPSAPAPAHISISEVPKNEHVHFLTHSAVERSSEVSPARATFGELDDTTEKPPVSDVLQFDQTKLKHLRIFRAVDRTIDQVIATAFLHPVMVEGLVFPKLTFAARMAGATLPPTDELRETGWGELQIIHPDYHRKGIGGGFAKKIQTSARFDLRKSFSSVMGVIDISDPVALAFFGSLRGRGLFTLGKLSFARFPIPSPGTLTKI